VTRWLTTFAGSMFALCSDARVRDEFWGMNKVDCSYVKLMARLLSHTIDANTI